MDSSRNCQSLPSMKEMIHLVTLTYSRQPLFFHFNMEIKLVHVSLNHFTYDCFPQQTELTLLSVKYEFFKAALLVLYSPKSPDPAAVTVLASRPDPRGVGSCGSLE